MNPSSLLTVSAAPGPAFPFTPSQRYPDPRVEVLQLAQHHIDRHPAGGHRLAQRLAQVDRPGAVAPALGRQPGRQHPGQRRNDLAHLAQLVAGGPQELHVLGQLRDAVHLHVIAAELLGPELAGMKLIGDLTLKTVVGGAISMAGNALISSAFAGRPSSPSPLAAARRINLMATSCRTLLPGLPGGASAAAVFCIIVPGLSGFSVSFGALVGAVLALISDDQVPDTPQRWLDSLEAFIPQITADTVLHSLGDEKRGGSVRTTGLALMRRVYSDITFHRPATC